MDDTQELMTQEDTEQELITIDDEKILALAQHLNISTDDTDILNITQSSYDDCVYEYGNEEYLVCTDSEADDKWEVSLDDYIEQCIMPEVPEWIQNYFDEDAWKRDARMDGRGHSLSGYDGNEHEEGVNGTDYYIYRVN